MPFYDLNRATSTNGTASTTSTHLWSKTVANQETVGITGVYCAAKSTTPGGAQLRVNDNTGATASGGTGQTPIARNRRVGAGVAAQSVWANDASAITPGGTLSVRLTIGFAQTGGMGGWVAIVPAAAIQMAANAANPVDVEFQSQAASTTIPFDLSTEFYEGAS